MTKGAFVSYAQNGEDVVLHRALGSVVRGRYIDVGANDPTVDSVSRAFYDQGWRGITVEPVQEYADRQRSERPGDIVIQAAITRTGGESVELFEVPGTGLSTLDREFGAQHLRAGYQIRETRVPTRRLDEVLLEADWLGEDIHFMSVDVEGSEADVLASLDLRQFRPWIIVAEATRPQSSESTHESWEPLLTSAGYRFVLFDGLSRFYLAEEHWDRLHGDLSAPANPLDEFVRHPEALREELVQELREQLATVAAQRSEAADLEATLRSVSAELTEQAAAARAREQAALASAMAWRTRAVGAWAQSVTTGSAVDEEELDFLRRQTHVLTQEMKAMRQTLSWRVTRPMRTVRSLGKRIGR